VEVQGFSNLGENPISLRSSGYACFEVNDEQFDDHLTFRQRMNSASGEAPARGIRFFGDLATGHNFPGIVPNLFRMFERAIQNELVRGCP
jgi:hypothetical protein